LRNPKRLSFLFSQLLLLLLLSSISKTCHPNRIGSLSAQMGEQKRRRGMREGENRPKIKCFCCWASYLAAGWEWRVLFCPSPCLLTAIKYIGGRKRWLNSDMGKEGNLIEGKKIGYPQSTIHNQLTNWTR
jgi:hypothetical protein